MRDALRFALKSFFGGCLGCLGALVLVTIVALLLSLVLGPKISGTVNTFIQSLQESVSHLIPSPSENTPIPSPTLPSMNQQQFPPMDVFLTLGNYPDSKHITSFSVGQTKQVYFWARAPQGADFYFGLLLTQPDGKQTPFGPMFRTNTTGKAIPCGQFESQATVGNYRLDVTLVGSSYLAGSVEFKVTK
jgi:hypothetical protein